MELLLKRKLWRSGSCLHKLSGNCSVGDIDSIDVKLAIDEGAKTICQNSLHLILN